MIQSKKFVAAALLTGIAMACASLVVAPFNATASAAAGDTGVDIAAERIGAAFATISMIAPDAATSAALVRAAKGDLGAPDCNGATWPNIDASCLATADGAPAPRVRTITIGYQADTNTTVLMRIPAAEMAAR